MTDSNGRNPTSKSLLWRVGQVICRIATTLLFDLKVYNVHHVPLKGGALLISNHQSFLDPVLLAVRLPRPMSFMARSGLFTNPLFAWLIRNLNAFPIRQGSGDVGAMRETIRRLQEGHLLNIFPEGSRTDDGEISTIAPGAALVIRRIDVPVIPAVIEGSFQAWPKGRRLFGPHPIRVMYGPPLKVDGLKADQITHLIDTTLRQMLQDLRHRIEQERPR